MLLAQTAQNVATDSPYELFGWVTLALINAGLAESKNRGRLAWFVVSLILGPIATFLIVVWERLPDRTPEPESEPG